MIPNLVAALQFQMKSIGSASMFQLSYCSVVQLLFVGSVLLVEGIGAAAVDWRGTHFRLFKIRMAAFVFVIKAGVLQ